VGVIVNVKKAACKKAAFFIAYNQLLKSCNVYIFEAVIKEQIILSFVLLSGTMVYSYKKMFPDNANRLAPANQPAHILYQVNFEQNNPYPSWLSKQTATPYAIQIVETPVYDGKKAARFELRATDPENNNGTRAEIAFPGADNTPTPERWYAFAVFFPSENFDFDSSDEVISQWHQGGKATPALCIRTKAGRIKLRIKAGIDKKEWVDLGAIEKNAWQYYVIHVKHASGADGLVEIWRNGVQIVNHSGANMYDLSDGVFHAPNWKLGIYKADWNGSAVTKTNKRVLYFDAIKIGDAHASFADMKATTETGKRH
jgi:hypothetical protein